MDFYERWEPPTQPVMHCPECGEELCWSDEVYVWERRGVCVGGGATRWPDAAGVFGGMRQASGFCRTSAGIEYRRFAMDWKKAAIEDLEQYPYRKLAIRNLSERIEALDSVLHSAGGGGIGRVGHAPRDAMRGQEEMIERLCEREWLQRNLELNEVMVRQIERGLAALEKEQRMVLQRLYDKRERGAAQRLALELHIDRATVYRLRDEALCAFTLAMFGWEGA